MSASYASLKKTLSLAAPLTLLLLNPLQANAGAWVGEKGSGYLKLGYAQYTANDTFGDSNGFDEFEGTNISLYGEYGLGHQFALYGSLLYQDIEQSIFDSNNRNASTIATTDANTGFSDIEVGLKYQWLSGPVVLSTSFLVKLPYLYDEDDSLPLGNGQEDYEVRVLAGKSLNQYGYFGVEAGYRLRTDAPSDEYRYLLEYGFSASESLYFRTKLDGTKSVKNADTTRTQNGTNLALASEFDIAKLELTAGWNFEKAADTADRWGIEFTYTDDVDGENTLDGQSFQLGLTRVF